MQKKRKYSSFFSIYNAKGWFFALIILIFILGFNARNLYQGQETEKITGFVISQTCADDNTIFEISALENAHAGLWNSGYINRVCSTASSAGRLCSGTNAVIRLSGIENTHAEKAGLTTIGYSDVCFGQNFNCWYEDSGNGACSTGKCAATMSSATNAHVAGCATDITLPYPISVCCAVTGCAIQSASITANCASGASANCEPGETISMYATLTGDCSSASIFQVDAVSSDALCNVQYIGGTMSGVTSSVVLQPTSASVSGTWTIPTTIPANCLGKTISATAAGLWDSAFTVQASSTNLVTGLFTFASQPSPPCNNDGICESNEDCTCADCDQKTDGCPAGEQCDFTTEACVAAPSETHFECQYDYLTYQRKCVQVSGAGMDQCASYTNCQFPICTDPRLSGTSCPDASYMCTGTFVETSDYGSWPDQPLCCVNGFCDSGTGITLICQNECVNGQLECTRIVNGVSTTEYKPCTTPSVEVPFFTWFNIISVIFILIGFYMYRAHKNHFKHSGLI